LKLKKEDINTKEALEKVSEDITQYGDVMTLQLEALGAALKEALQSREQIVLELKKIQGRAYVAELALTLIEQDGGKIGKLVVEQAVAQARSELKLDD